ncbi:MAG TPA: hypothetical protein VFR41_15600 [Acidimicrobiia bacterium]|nr:hypothetical protein [Acidimicrobiia bacterium]
MSWPGRAVGSAVRVRVRTERDRVCMGDVCVEAVRLRVRSVNGPVEAVRMSRPPERV